MNHRNSIKMYLSIFGDTFDPEELSNLLQLTPTETSIKENEIILDNKLYANTKTICQETSWDYGSDYINTYDSQDASIIIENAFKDKVPLVNDFSVKHNLKVKLFVIPYLDTRPTRSILGIFFSQSFIKMLSDLNAEIDIDMYRA